jgi:quinol monooxygenase YgiN
MRRVIVRYTVKPDKIDDNVALVQAVFAQLEREKPEGLRYATLRDGANFVHIAAVDTADNPLVALAAFKAFTAAIKDRCVEPPVTTEMQEVGSYRLLR